jgi:ribosomal protein S27AE
MSAMPMTRRGFLRGSALAAAALAGTGAFPFPAVAQEPSSGQQTGDEPRKDDTAGGRTDETDQKKDGDKPKDEDPFKVTKKDEQGRDYRVCPQCGFNMYKQDRTWTCENCGYSYVE